MIRAALCVAALALAGPAHAQLGHGTLGKSQPSLYWGAVAGPTEVPYQKDTIILAAMSRAPEWANDGVSQIEVVLPDFIYAGTGWADHGTSQSPGGATTITASIEYPAGTCTPLTFSGSTTGTIANDSYLASDPLTIAIPAGAQFWVRAYRTITAGGMPWDETGGSTASHYESSAGEFALGYTTAASGQDATQSCAATGSWTTTGSAAGTGGGSATNYGAPYKPVAVLGYTQMPSVCLVGDSRTHGFYDIANGGYNPGTHFGQFDRWVGATFGTINLGSDSDTGSNATGADWQVRGSLLKYCTHVAWGFGVNDIKTGTVSAANEESYFAGMISTYGVSVGGAAQKWFAATIYPFVLSTDNDATTVNQIPFGAYATAAYDEAQREQFNTDCRSNLATAFPGAVACIDIDKWVEDGPNYQGLNGQTNLGGTTINNTATNNPGGSSYLGYFATSGMPTVSLTALSCSGNVVTATLNASSTYQPAAATTASGAWASAATTITLASVNNVHPGVSIYDATTSQTIGTVASLSNHTITLNAGAASASSGAADTLYVIGQSFPVTIAGAAPSGYNVTNVTATATLPYVSGTQPFTFTYPVSSCPGTETAAGTFQIVGPVDVAQRVSGDGLHLLAYGTQMLAGWMSPFVHTLFSR
ncbi:hypothetical protein [Roseiarcus sp.]|uniref:hypothetical protein n=1 Tax=Roseiarcus sp. TaxID=1969460 RepID=UPI003F967C92